MSERDLLELAAHFDRTGQPLHAIQCLLGLLGMEGKLLPDVETRARARLGRLLVHHTHNLRQAKTHLQTAQQLCGRLRGMHCLKAEVASSLGELCRCMGDADMGVAALRQGLDACAAGAASSERAALPRWVAHLHMQLSDLHAAVGADADAQASVAAGLEAATKAELLPEALLFRLSAVQLSMLAGGDNAARVTAALRDARAAAGAVAAARAGEDGAAGAAHAFVLYSQLHLELLQLIQNLAVGAISEFDVSPGPGGGPALIQGIDVLLSEVEDRGPGELGYSWIPPPAMRCIALLAASELLAASGSVAEAGQQLDAAESALASARASLGLPPPPQHHPGSSRSAGPPPPPGADGGADGTGIPTGQPSTDAAAAAAVAGTLDRVPRADQLSASLLGDDTLDHVELWEARPLAVLALAVGGQRAQLALLQGQYAVARGHVLGCMAQLLVSPTLRPLAPHVHTLAGLYCHGVGQYTAAEGHFGAAQALHEGVGSATGRDVSAAAAAAALRACALLAQDAPDSVSRAIEAIGGLQDASSPSTAPGGPSASAVLHTHARAGRHARCALQLVSGLVRLRLAASATSADASAEQARAAKLALSKALKVAHQTVRHHQLVTSVMLAMVPVQLRSGAVGGGGGGAAAGGTAGGDVAGAAQMLSSADLLARNNGDGATRAAVKRAMLDVLAAQGADEGTLAAARTDADARAAKLARAREGAVAADPRAHAAVMAWGLA
ncbi:hypothetical protein FOA52_006195 [Chlamydomonas sp. UWO 241]|nr:hypothetical protein FOA52_006195 [Chlamydomonas sp. UWO 241]